MDSNHANKYIIIIYDLKVDQATNKNRYVRHKKNPKIKNPKKILFFSLYIEGVNKMLKKTTTPKPPKKTLYYM